MTRTIFLPALRGWIPSAGGGIDAIDAGGGNDLLVGGPGGDLLEGNAGIDTASYEDSAAEVAVNLLIGRGFLADAEGDTLRHIENVIGSNYDDVINGDSGANRIEGLAGDDLIVGLDGPDHLFGNRGDDIISGDLGRDFLFGGAGVDYLDGGRGADHLDGGPGAEADTAGYTGSDIGVLVNLAVGAGFSGEADGDVLVDIENLYGSLHEDVLVGDDEANTLAGNLGDDQLIGAGSADVLLGGALPQEGDIIVFPPGDNLSDGNDTLNGGSGRDQLIGGTGADRLTGGRDADYFVWRTVHETGVTLDTMDLITDFRPQQGDKIDLHEIDADEDAFGNQDFVTATGTAFIGNTDFSAPGQIRYATDGIDTFIILNTDADLDAEAFIRVAGSYTPPPDASWFLA